MNKQETITDIIREIRAEANSIEESARGSLKVGEDLNGMPFIEAILESALDLAETKRKEADRLEAALKREVKEKLARCKRINALVSERAKANLTIQEVAKRMGITYRQLHDIEETWEDKDLQDFPKVARAYIKAIRRTKKKGVTK